MSMCTCLMWWNHVTGDTGHLKCFYVETNRHTLKYRWQAVKFDWLTGPNGKWYMFPVSPRHNLYAFIFWPLSFCFTSHSFVNKSISMFSHFWFKANFIQNSVNVKHREIIKTTLHNCQQIVCTFPFDYIANGRYMKAILQMVFFSRLSGGARPFILILTLFLKYWTTQFTVAKP